MPTRILREGIITSELVNRLTPESELFYRRLMSVLDDYGRYFAHPSLLRAACYPLQLEKVCEADVQRMLSECVAVGLLAVYASGKCLQCLNFRQQVRGKSKFPEPTENELLSNCTANVKQMRSESESESESKAYPGLGGNGKAKLPETEAVRAFLFRLYKRPPEQATTYLELSLISEVAARPGVKQEMELLEKKKAGDKFFPQSIESLLSKWSPTLDRCRRPKQDGPEF